MFATGISRDGDGVSALILSRRPSLSPPQDWLCREKSLDHLVQALDHDGWWSAFGPLRARQLLAREPLVPDPVWLVGGGAQFFVAERFVVADVALEPAHLAVALEGEDVGRDTVQEPAVVADDHDASRERLQSGLERSQRVHVEVVGGFVEEQDVAARLEQLGEVNPVPLSAGQRAHELLLVRAPEVEAGHVRPRGDLALADLDELGALCDLLEHRPSRVEVVAALVHVAELYGLADRDGAGVGRLIAYEHPKQRRLARAVGPDDPHDARSRQRERQILDEQLVAVPLFEVRGLDDGVAQAGAGRNGDLEFSGDALVGLGLSEKLVVGLEAGFALALASAGR